MKNAPVFQEESAKYGGSKSFIISKKQLAYPAKDLQDSTAETMLMTGWFDDVGHFLVMLPKLIPYAVASLESVYKLFLRSGVITRVAGQTFSKPFPKWPNSGGDIVDKAADPIKFFDDPTAIESSKRLADVDFQIHQHSEAAIDLSSYEKIKETYLDVIGQAVATDYNNLAQAYAIAGGLGVTLSRDPTFVPLIDSSRRPDQNTSPAAYKYFDPNGEFVKFIKKEIFGQAKQKLKNNRKYLTNYLNPHLSKIEIKQPTKVTADANATEFSKWYLSKENSKQYLLPNTTRFLCVVALYNAIRSACWDFHAQRIPTNWAGFDPYATAEITDIQISCGFLPFSEIEVLMNVYDYNYQNSNAGSYVSSTSPDGNLVASLKDLEEAGVTFYKFGCMLEGNAKVQQVGTFRILNYLDKSFTNSYNFYIAQKYGRHVFDKVKIVGLGCYINLIPEGGYVPHSDTMLLHYKSLEQA